MPIFECSRCNELSYSAAAEPAQACARCGDTRCRVLSGGFESARGSARDLAPGDHASYVYDDPALVAPFCARFLTEGVDTGQCVMAAVPDDLRSLVEPLLAPDVRVLIEWHDAHAIYGDFDADRTAAMFDERIAGEPRTMRILGIIDQVCVESTSPAELDRYETLAHDILARHGAIGFCLYDARGLDPAVIGSAIRRHTLQLHDGAIRRNDLFEYEPAA